MNSRSWTGLVALSLLLVALSPARAETGVTPTTILIGQSVSLSGPTGSLGQEMQAGAVAYFNHVNKQGGVNGRAIVLKTLDDAYEVDKTVANVKALIENDGVFALFGLRGTAHTNAAAKIFIPAQVPLFATFSGAQSLREPFNRYIFHVRASYADETDATFKQLSELKLNRIGVFYQNDGYGKEGKAAAEEAVKKYELTISALGSVEPNSSDVVSAVAAIARIQPQAVVMYASYKASAEFVRGMRKAQLYPQYMNLSIVGATALAKELGNDARGIGVSQVVPYPWNIGIPIVKEYQRVMKEQTGKSDYSFLTLESYLAARILVDGLRRAGPDLTREKLIAALETMHDASFGGFRVDYSRTNHAASRFVELTVIGRDGAILR
ncbi:MAG TPA: ABC transporter substrate-binding protein [Casimicrobiaceae bacterium]|jgi:branched-chain amino acid transport system substrate-binding protein|nr:ABC transporter substrate-binding protein [Casimicrobiaceae bacterium]